MNPRGDRSIRNVSVSQNPRRSAPLAEDDFADDFVPPRRSRSRLSFKLLLWTIGALIFAAVLGIVLSMLFASTTVTVHPKKLASITPPPTMVAEKNAQPGTLSYQTMSITQIASTTVQALGTETVSLYASGKVTISNAYGTGPQQLIASTRLQAQDGKIYRIREAVTVPGGTKKSDGSITPGTLVVTIYADAPGAEYNRTAPTRFTIPGFKNDPRYTKMYAESEGSFTGGLVGEQPTVSPDELAKAQTTLQTKLDGLIKNAVSSNMPAGFRFVEGSVVTTYGDISRTPGQGKSLTLAQGATASVSIVRASDLAAALARVLSPDYAGEPVAFADPAEITVKVSVPPKNDGESMILALEGSPTIVWEVDTEAIKEAILGKDKKDLEAIPTTFKPSVVAIEASIKPFWQSTLPLNPAEVVIRVAK
jgi:hypothetical protein